MKKNQTVEPDFIKRLREEAEAAGGRIERAVPGHSGLRARCRPGRREVAFVWYGTAPSGARMLKSVGEYPAMSIEDAGEALSKVRARASLGMAGLVVGEKLGPTSTVKDAVEHYARRVLSGWERPERPHRALVLHVVNQIGRVKLASLVPEHIEAVVSRLLSDGKHGQAKQILQNVKAMLDLAERDGAFARSPAATLTASDFPAMDNAPSRKRHALDDLAVLWRFLAEEPDDKRLRVSRLSIRVLLATARRSGELLRAERSEFDLDAGIWTVPVKNQKLKKKARRSAEPIVVKLPPQTVADLRRMFAASPMSKWVCAAPLNPEKHLSSTVFARNLRQLHERGVAKTKASPHTFRRAFRTVAPEKRLCDPGIAELVLSHRPPGIQGVYDVAGYVEQRGEALVAWANYLDRLSDKAESNVTEISSRTASATA